MPPSISESVETFGPLLAVSITFLVLSTIVCFLRFWIRNKQKASLRPDDWFVMPAYATYFAASIVLFIGVHQKLMGYTSVHLHSTPDGVKRSTILGILLDVFAALNLGFVKLSALFFYKRVLCSAQRITVFEIVLYVFMVITVLWTITFAIFPLAQCGNHLEALWTGQSSKYCPAGRPYLFGFAYSDLIIETFIVFLPLPKIWALQISTRRRISVICVFLAAFISLGANIARVVIFAFAAESAGAKVDSELSNSAKDFMYILEMGAALVAVNLPSLYYLRGKVIPEKIFASIRSALSLQSFSPKNSPQQTQKTNAESDKDQNSETRQTGPATTTTSSSSVSTHYQQDDEDRNKSGIQVTSQISHHFDQV